MRDAARNPPLGHLEPAALVAHRELAYLRNPTAERLRKLQEAQAQLDAGGGGSDAA